MAKKILLLSIFLLTLWQSLSAATQPVYVIVHGAYGGSWAFKKTDSLLTAKGCLVYRPSLTGQGERVHLASPDIGLTTHINDVVNMILYEDLRNVILVGHSYGGMVISGVADRIPERIQKMIYLDAYAPNDGESVKTILGDNFSRVEKLVQNGFMVPTWNKANKIPGDVPQSLKTFTEPVSLKNPMADKINHVYILTIEKGKKPEEDDFYPQAARAKQRNWAMFPMEADHNPQWSAVDKLAEMLYQNK
jgi:pimeloyl-ACP methyl ester carboxylesterase